MKQNKADPEEIWGKRGHERLPQGHLVHSETGMISINKILK